MIYIRIVVRVLLDALFRFVRQVQISKYALDNGARIGYGANYTGDLERFSIGPGTVINAGVNLRFKNGFIKIGSSCLIGRNCSIVSNRYALDKATISAQDMTGDGVTIGDNVLIGNNVVILPGVVVGNGAVIGANCVVSKDIGDFEVHGGVPNGLIYTRKAL